MKYAGYAQLNRRPVLGEDGAPLDILELHICRTRLCIRLFDLNSAVHSGFAVNVEKLKWNWMAYTGGVVGSARVSKSGKALNIELFNGERFTLALEALQAVISCREHSATVASLPPRVNPARIKDRCISDFIARAAGEGERRISPRDPPAQLSLIACET
ncbi:MAG TPA: hypothetical protein PLN56_03845 [Methanoregulaceae archaeon]|nr:MAG: hypothetical protein IPI71_08450 [Methanolinea sp.]HON81279.1 hypothetical protein [Methanoregulaceae archaeon]HPD10115.1 hypothetical protein [Methanoregulaceae archaeon]HRT15121.1 hypothetical protein [Methanoregulaceae archaeon]HRU30762.1 hypothetical protein [Methanoregulaceae archaeon]